MENVNWDEAPEWATHALTTGPKWAGRIEFAGRIHWARFDGKTYFNGIFNDVRFCIGSESWVVVESRPKWNESQGTLPPVGTVCQFRSVRGWEQVKVVHIGKDGEYDCAVLQSKNNMYIGSVLSDFRAIKTKEQREIEMLQDDINRALTNNATLSEYLYIHGWRKTKVVS